MNDILTRLDERTKNTYNLLVETRKEVAEIRKSDSRITKLEEFKRLCVWLLATFGVAIITIGVERLFH